VTSILHIHFADGSVVMVGGVTKWRLADYGNASRLLIRTMSQFILLDNPVRVWAYRSNR
jgi:hypothetical protein